MEQHGCGGALLPAVVMVTRNGKGLCLIFRADGVRCDQCGEELVSRDTAVAMEQFIGTGGTPTVMAYPLTVDTGSVAVLSGPVSTQRGV